MTLIQKICALGFGTMGTAFCSAAVSYGMRTTKPEKVSQAVISQKELFQGNPWGRVEQNDEEGGNAWWKSKEGNPFN